MLALLILAALVATLVAGCGGAGSGALHRLSKSSRRREAPALRSRRPKVRDLPDYDSGTPRSGDADAPVVLTEYADYQ